MNDKENAVDMLIGRRLMKRMRTSLRWIPRTLMLADGLTKDDGPASDVLRSAMRHAVYKIGDEEEALQKNRDEKERRLARGRERQAQALQNGQLANDVKKLTKRTRHSPRTDKKAEELNQMSDQNTMVATFQ